MFLLPVRDSGWGTDGIADANMQEPIQPLWSGAFLVLPSGLLFTIALGMCSFLSLLFPVLFPFFYVFVWPFPSILPVLSTIYIQNKGILGIKKLKVKILKNKISLKFPRNSSSAREMDLLTRIDRPCGCCDVGEMRCDFGASLCPGVWMALQGMYANMTQQICSNSGERWEGGSLGILNPTAMQRQQAVLKH